MNEMLTQQESAESRVELLSATPVSREEIKH